MMSDLMIELFARVDDPAFESILENIFLHLDGTSLLHCRLVCSHWRSFIINRIFNNKKSRLILEERLHRQWIYAEPSETRIDLPKYESWYDEENKTLSDEERPAITFECDDDIIVCANERFLEIRKMPFGEVDVRFKDFKVSSNKTAEIQQVLLSDTIIATVTYFISDAQRWKTYKNIMIVKMFSRDDYALVAKIVAPRFDFDDYDDGSVPHHRVFLIKNTLCIVRQKERRIYSEDGSEYNIDADGPVYLRQYQYDHEKERVTQRRVNLEHDYVLHEYIENASVDARGEHFLFLGGCKCLVYNLKSGVKVLDMTFDNEKERFAKAQLFDTTANKTYAIVRNEVPFFNSGQYRDSDFLVIDLDTKSIVRDIYWDIDILKQLTIHKRLAIEDHDSGDSDGEGEFTLEFYPTSDICGFFLDPTEKQNIVRDRRFKDHGYLFYKDDEPPRNFRLVDGEWVLDDDIEEFKVLRTFVVDCPGFEMKLRKNKTSLVCLLHRVSRKELRIYNFFRNLEPKN